MSSEQISALPIFGRNTFYSSISTPGVIQSGDPQFVRYQDQSGASSISMGGGPRRGNAYLLEGVSITDFVNRPSWVPSTEAIEDMRVQVEMETALPVFMKVLSAPPGTQTASYDDLDSLPSELT
jgi:hypothetical protein